MRQDRAGEIGSMQIGLGEVDSFEKSTIHLRPPQHEPREIQLGEIRRTKVRAAALAPLRLHIQPMAHKDPLDLLRRKHAKAAACCRADHSAKGRSRCVRSCHRAILLAGVCNADSVLHWDNARARVNASVLKAIEELRGSLPPLKRGEGWQSRQDLHRASSPPCRVSWSVTTARLPPRAAALRRQW